jgi:hypothetical protein
LSDKNKNEKISNMQKEYDLKIQNKEKEIKKYMEKSI